MIDCHTHSKYSPDSKTLPEEHVKAAISKGVTHVCITEHMDFPTVMKAVLPNEKLFTYDITPSYPEDYALLKEKYGDKISISVGVEAGWTKEDEPRLKEEIDKYGFEYVVNSIHLVDGIDIYWPRYYENRTKKETYSDYLRAVLASLDAPFRYDCVGHLGYISRYSVYKDDRELRFEEFPEQIDMILKKIIENDTFLEINTRDVQNGLFIPDPSILKRYFSLGGELLTIGSDAHRPGAIASGYEAARDLALSIGFKYFTYKRNGRIEGEKL